MTVKQVEEVHDHLSKENTEHLSEHLNSVLCVWDMGKLSFMLVW